MVGPVAQLMFVDGYEPGFMPIYAGEYFKVPPKIQFLDNGGNYVVEDSTSAVLVVVDNSPVVGAFIGPSDKTFVVASRGVVSFNALTMSTQGYNYTLLFTFYEFSALEKRFYATTSTTTTPITLSSEKLHVDYGPSRRLVLTSNASDAWAGGQPFTNQPIIQLEDYGGNRLALDYTTVGVASMVESLSVNEDDVVIYTADAPITSIQHVSINDHSDGSYGAGEVFDIIITFKYHVWIKFNLTTTTTYEDFPYLVLNVQRRVSVDAIYDHSIQSYHPIARVIGKMEQTKSLIFRYSVMHGDETLHGTYLDYLNKDSLKTNHSSIVDGNHLSINYSLPFHTISSKQFITIDTSAPIVTSITTNVSSNVVEYGAGEAIDIIIAFDKPVVVVGYPYLLLTASNSSNPYAKLGFNTANDVIIYPTPANATAIYSHSSTDLLKLHFIYIVGEYDNTQHLQIASDHIEFNNQSTNSTWPIWLTKIATDHIEFNNQSTNGTSPIWLTNQTHPIANLIYPRYIYDYNYTNIVSGYIKHNSTYPTTFANYDIQVARSVFANNYTITIDTSIPYLDPNYGLQTTHPDGTYYAGEFIYLTVRFTKPITIYGDGILIKLDAGPHQYTSPPSLADYIGNAYIQRVYDDDMTVEFLYIVEEHVNTTRLDIAPGNDSLVITGRGAYILRKSTHPVTKANPNTTSLYNSHTTSLRSTSALHLIGYPPVVLSTTLQATYPANTSDLYPDDYALIEVTFSAPVVTLCAPVLVIQAMYFREAHYISGNGTDRYLFKYTVLVGDQASELKYRHTPNALCAVSGCPYKTTKCNIFANATVLTLPTDLKLFRIENHNVYKGVPVLYQHHRIHPLALNGSNNNNNNNNYRMTTIVSVYCKQDPGYYGAGSVLVFAVVFKDIVILNSNKVFNSSLPKLHLNIGTYAYYSGGSHTTTLYFTYITTSSDVSTTNNVTVTINPITLSAIDCLAVDRCSITNQAKQAVDLRITQADNNNIVLPTGIVLDPTPPHVIKVWSTKKSSSYSNADYSVGELILIYVECSRPVIVTGFDPRLIMSVSQSERYAIYNRFLSTSTILVFVYQVKEGDYSPELTYTTRSIDLYGGNSKIYRLSFIPTTLMDTTLPASKSLSLSGQHIRINTLVIPTVIRVNSLNSESCTLYAGDSVTLRVEFSVAIVALGRSYLTLNLGEHIGIAYYVGYNNYLYDHNPINYSPAEYNTASNATKFLFYRYDIIEDHFTENLDYIDVFSLFVGLTDVNDRGFIGFPSTVAELPAVLDLPMPGTNGSISSDGIIVRIDGRAPYLTGFKYLTPSGIYGVGTDIMFTMTFSSPVYVDDDGGRGIPSIKLETGYVDNHAYYVNGSRTNQLLFVYKPEPGDHSIDLDYHSERSMFSSSIYSFNYNGASILAYSAKPFLKAQIWLNPPFGNLISDLKESSYPTWSHPAAPLGGLQEVSAAGTIQFNDLKITHRGPNYLLRFSTETNDVVLSGVKTLLTTTQFVNVSFSAETQLVPVLSKKQQLVGQCVAIDGDIAVLGCPNCNMSVFTIQSVITSASPGPSTREVQLIKTDIVPQPAIISFRTTAGVGEIVGGTFKIMYGDTAIYLGPTQGIPANANADMIEAIIRFDLPSLGAVTVTREAYIFCACENAFTWTITFLDIIEGPFDQFIFDASLLTGLDATVVGPNIIQLPALLGGTFSLSALGRNTSQIPYDATVLEIKDAISLLNIPVYDVFISPSTISRTRAWSITFDAYLDSYEIPLLICDGSQLTGGKTSIFSEITRPGINGPKGIAGFFALKFRGNTTEFLPADVSADQVKSALQALPTIEFVNVERSRVKVNHGYTWTIEFVELRVLTSRGLVLQESSNVEPLEYVNKLIGTNVSIEVQAIYNLSSRNSISGIARQGTYGANAGAVHIYQRHNESWDEMITIRGTDTVTNSRFGCSVAIVGDVVLVGSEGANLNGVPEIQSLYCSAQSGYFYLKFRGWKTDAISYNVTREELIDAMVSVPTMFSKLYTIDSIDIADWGGGSLCDNKTAIITFYSPINGDALLLGDDTGSNLELLTPDIGTLRIGVSQKGLLEIAEVQKGTWNVSGGNSDKQQIGAAYVFRASYSCLNEDIEYCYKRKWIQETKLVPTLFQPGSRFGYAVALSETIALVGAPGSYNQRGAVYTYEYSQLTKNWNFLQIITLVDSFAQGGDHFGSSFSISENTLIIAAPDYRGRTGIAFVYSRPPTGGKFIASLSLNSAIAQSFPLSPGDLFGRDISLVGNNVVVGAPGFNDKTVYVGDIPSASAVTKSGAVFIFSRISTAFNFKFDQKLQPSNVKELDGFGYSVDLDGNNLIVSSWQDYEGPLFSNLPVVEIKTDAAYNGIKLSGSFKIKWLHTLSNQTLETRNIRYDANAVAMRDMLQNDLKTGPLLVSRSAIDQYSGGYSWSVTFMNYEGEVSLFTADIMLLGGTNATVASKYLNPNPIKLRGMGHLFQRKSIDEPFIEQMFLSPYSYQPMDRCGVSVGISGKYVLMGCPNRDLRLPGQNSGAGFIFHIGLVALDFDRKITVKEGNIAEVEIIHDSSNIVDIDEDLFFYLATLDRNAFHSMQVFIQHVFGLPDPTTTYPDTMLDRSLIVGKAVGRAQFYGSSHNESSWVDGMYDYRAISDYVPIKHEEVLLREANQVIDYVVTTEDNILEVPDEHIILVISSPGIWPSVFGRLYGQIRIYGPADGNVRGRMRYRKVYNSMSISTEGISSISVATSQASNTKVATANPAGPNEAYGTTISIINDINGINGPPLSVMMVGAPGATVGSRQNAGKVLFYRMISEQNWTQQADYFTSPLPELKGTRFGEAVALNKVHNRNMSILVIGEPSINRAYVYLSSNDYLGEHYKLDLILTPGSSNSSSRDAAQQRFGASVALDGFVLTVSAPLLETIWMYRRIYDSIHDQWYWTSGAILRSSDYDYDIIRNVQVLHRQHFGTSMSINQRSIAVGAPFADYDKLGTDLVEVDWDTEGTSIFSYGRGKVYVFYSSPASQVITISTPYQVGSGQFRLRFNHQGMNRTSDVLSYDILPDQLHDALVALDNIDDVQISYSTTASKSGFFEYSWTVTFVNDFEDSISSLEPLWYGFGCMDCNEFSFLDNNDISALNVTILDKVIQVKILSTMTPFSEIQTLSASNKRNGDRFGSAIAIDGDQIIIGSPYSCGMTTTSWDFEAGSLMGWHRTGDAFDHQPTFGDNSYFRSNQKGRQSAHLLRPQKVSSGLIGLYYIGTYEKRPGSPSNYQVPHPDYPAGSSQGDFPRGTLSSDVFIVRGTNIKFLIGGGCDPIVVYVELLVDGLSVAKQTGLCSEVMRSVSFDVTSFYDRAAQIKIVDNSTANWGHINVDNFEFNWDVKGATIPDRNNMKTSTGGVLETPFAGAAYLYYRDNCLQGDKITCRWTQEAIFTASDKRSDMNFGSSVAVNGNSGVVFVGAPSADLTGFYKEVPSVYPFLNKSDFSTVADITFPIDPSYMQYLQSFPLYGPVRSGARAFWQVFQSMNQSSQLASLPDEAVSEGVGAVYVYTKTHPKFGSKGEIVTPHYWNPIEIAKIQPLDGAAKDGFGSSISLSNHLVAFGSPGHDGLLKDAGATYVYSTEFASLKFTQVLD